MSFTPAAPAPLPIDGHLAEIVARLREHRAVVVTAAPGAGKTTRVPPALLVHGRVLLLQPRRVAARAVAQRIAHEQGWTIGREIGWHVRFDRRESDKTRLLVATEGILTARLQHDPLLSAFRTIVLDEFHERSIHSDLGLALARQAWLARDDLHIVVMSATLDAAAVAAFLDDCPVVDVPGRQFPVEVTYRPDATAEAVVVDEAPRASGAILVFLPGAREISRAADAIAQRLGGSMPILQLHGRLDASRQDEALVPSDRPRVIVATNVAETTLTVPDVRLVVDAGWQKVMRYDVNRGFDRLDTERVSRDAADQRAGRAGRVGPGRAIRLWEERARLRAHRQAEIARVDLAGPVLDVAAWGADPRAFEWFESPPADALEGAMELLRRLDLIDEHGRLTSLGDRLHRLPLHPRLSRLLLAADGALEAARAVALLAEARGAIPFRGVASTACDIYAAVDGALPPHIERVARDLQATVRHEIERPREHIDEETFRRAVLAAYPDRVGKRRASGSDRVQLATGTGARMGRESGVTNHEFLIAVDVATPSASGAQASNEAVIHMATGIERDWLTPTSLVVEHEFDSASGVVRAKRMERYGTIVLNAVDVVADPVEAARLMADAIVARGPRESDRSVLARLAAAGMPVTFADLAQAGGRLVRRLDDFEAADYLPHDARRALEANAPADLPLPSGRRARLDYREDGRVLAAVKLQELFGLADTPRVGLSQVPVTFELLAPNGRPVQVTSDLRSFWTHGYQEVRKELRARYPRHPWPEDPWTAHPTHRTVKRH